jgi:hypothetical protein
MQRGLFTGFIFGGELLGYLFSWDWLIGLGGPGIVAYQ